MTRPENVRCGTCCYAGVVFNQILGVSTTLKKVVCHRLSNERPAWKLADFCGEHRFVWPDDPICEIEEPARPKCPATCRSCGETVDEWRTMPLGVGESSGFWGSDPMGWFCLPCAEMREAGDA